LQVAYFFLLIITNTSSRENVIILKKAFHQKLIPWQFDKQIPRSKDEDFFLDSVSTV